MANCWILRYAQNDGGKVVCSSEAIVKWSYNELI